MRDLTVAVRCRHRRRRQVAAWRFGFDWGATDHDAFAGRFRVPILLFHGDDDERAPVERSRRFAAARADIVRYVEVAGAGHVRAWNAGPAAYEAAVASFLRGVMEGAVGQAAPRGGRATASGDAEMT